MRVGDIAIVSGGAVTFEAVKDLHDESHTKSKGDLAWTSSKGKGNTDETLRQTQMIAEGSVVIKAVDGLKIDIKQIDQNTVSQTIDVMVKADPQLAWLKEAEQRGDVDWRQVKELHDSFKYSNSGLGAGAQIIIAIIVTYFTMGPPAVQLPQLVRGHRWRVPRLLGLRPRLPDGPMLRAVPCLLAWRVTVRSAPSITVET